MPSIDKMVNSDIFPKGAVKGFASINYRLSGNSSDLHPTRHPDHIRDVRNALAYMQRVYAINNSYILVGHSVGATLTFQLLMGAEAAGEAMPDAPLPVVAVGLNGIYEFYAFAHRHGQSYIDFVAGALGPDQSKWNDAAPERFKGSYKRSWPVPGRRAVIASSPQDTLVDEIWESKKMADRLREDEVGFDFPRLKGDHDFVWQDGEQVAELMAEVLKRLSTLG